MTQEPCATSAKKNFFDLDTLRDITNGNCGALLYAPRTAQEQAVTDAPDMSAPNVHNEEVVTSTMYSVPQAGLESISNSDTLSDFEDDVTLKMTLDVEQIHTITRETIGQRTSPLWHNQRKGRITASRVHECIRKVNEEGNVVTSRNNSAVANIMGYTDRIQTKEMKWGIEKEKTCISHYTARQKRTHDKLEVLPTGLHISHTHQFIAGSPDALIHCTCCGKGVLEVKNPFSTRHETIQEMANKTNSCLEHNNGAINLKISHAYYAQVQCQMLVTDTTYADFVVRTTAKSDNIHIERIAYNNVYIEQMVTKCEVFFKTVIIPELYNKKIQRFYNTKVVEQIVHSLIENVVTVAEASVTTTPQPSTSAVTTPQPSTSADTTPQPSTSADTTPQPSTSYVCKTCNNVVIDDPSSVKEQSIACDYCEHWYHYPCVGIKGDERFLSSARAKWYCGECACKKNKTRPKVA
jgi:DNA-directed RNA polymerase subunit RPC12/RpoP